MTSAPETATLGTGPGAITLPRILTGLWELSDGFGAIDVEKRAAGIGRYVEQGYGAVDCADFYGPAETVIGAYNAAHPSKPLTTCTKWCPAQADVGEEATKAAVDRALERLGAKSIDLLQYHIWRYDAIGYLENLHYLAQHQSAGRIKQIGLTNVDLPHLRMLVSSGFPIASNQVSVSVLDRRVADSGMAAWCAANGVGIIAYGVLLGGFLTEKWLGKDEPVGDGVPSLSKYRRYIAAAGGWQVFQSLLRTLDGIAKKHNTTIPTIAIRHVLDQPGVTAVIVGSRLEPDSRLPDPALWIIKLDDADRAAVAAAQAVLASLPGEPGDDGRHAPFLTPTGQQPALAQVDPQMLREVERVAAAGGRVEYTSGSPWEDVVGYCRAVRTGKTITVAGTTTRPTLSGKTVGGSSAADQATHVFDVISGALTSLGGSLGDALRTRVLYANVEHWRDVGPIHAYAFRPYGVRPTDTMVGGTTFVLPTALLEIEVDAVVGHHAPALRVGAGGVLVLRQ